MLALRNIASEVLDLLLPRTCHLCERTLLPHEEHLCLGCRESLPRTLYHRSDMNPMAMRFAGQIPFERATGHFFYSPGNQFTQLVQNFKYRKFPSLALALGTLMGKELYTTGFFSDVDVIVPVPMHWLKQARRGYNQTHMLARGVSEATGIEVSLELRAVKSHRTQTSLSHTERRKNIKGIFRLRHPERFEGRHILLLDDVCTTGATLMEAAEAVLEPYLNPDTHHPLPGHTPPRLTLLSLCVTPG